VELSHLPDGVRRLDKVCDSAVGVRAGGCLVVVRRVTEFNGCPRDGRGGQHGGGLATASRTDATRRWVLEADLAAEFDHLNHDHICTSLGTFPAAGRCTSGRKRV